MTTTVYQIRVYSGDTYLGNYNEGSVNKKVAWYYKSGLDFYLPYVQDEFKEVGDKIVIKTKEI